MEGDILFERRGGLGLVTLNRSKTLNAVTLDMVRTLHAQVRAWEADGSVRAIAIRGEGRAFCAGGDVRLVHAARRHPRGPGDYKSELFSEEFRLMRRIHRLPKPWIALTHGITMGAGAGLSVNGSDCVASETSQFAMPEVFIGSFPDIGATHFYGRMPGRVGLYLALTGIRASAADAVAFGLARHFVPQARFEELTDALARGSAPANELLRRFRAEVGKSRLAALRSEIDRCFGQKSVEEIVSALRNEAADWAKEALAALERANPLSLKLAFEVLRRGAGMSLEDALVLEYRAMMHVMEGEDFFEGVRAVLIDKDQKPRWRYSSPAGVSAAEVERHFASLGEGELRL